MAWAGQPWLAACAVIATRLARCSPSHARAPAGPVTGRAARGPGCPRPVGIGGEQRARRGGGGGQVVVEEPGQRGPPARLAVVLGRPARRRRRAAGHACRTARARPTGPGRRAPAGQGAGRVPECAAGERGDVVCVEPGAGVQAQQPEGSRGAVIQVPDRPGEHGPDRGPRILRAVEQVQAPLPVSQIAGQDGQRDVAGNGGGALGGHPQRQGQPGAVPGQRGGRRRGRHPPAPR